VHGIWKILGFGVGGLLLLVAIMVFRASTARSVQITPPTIRLEPPLAPAIRHLQEAIQLKTVSRRNPADTDWLPFQAFRTWLRESYPLVHQHLQREVFADHALLYTWQGSDPSLKPVLFMAHYDVVAVEAGTEDEWEQPPFSGARAPCAEGETACIWGRGTMDIKGVAISLMEAVTAQLEAGYVPTRTVMIAFGHDEEVGSTGAQEIARILKDRGVQLEWVLDEGMVITDGMVPGARAPVALIGVGEKGYLTLELEARAEGGHSSMPQKETAITILAGGLQKLEGHPFSGGLDGAGEAMFEAIAPDLDFGLKLAFSNLWLLRPILNGVLSGQASTNALIRTTVAPTMLSASPQENVLPQVATATINLRLHPRDSVASATKFVRQLVGDDRITVRQRQASIPAEPAPISSHESVGYLTIERGVRGAFPDALVAPGMMIAITDSRFFLPIADDVYRFSPLILTPKTRAAIHGTNERLAVDNLKIFLRFYTFVIQEAGK